MRTSRRAACERLAHLDGDERGEVVGLVFEDGGELAHAESAVLERDGGVGAEGFGGEGDLVARGFVGEGIEAAQEFAGCGIDGFDGHGLRVWCSSTLMLA